MKNVRDYNVGKSDYAKHTIQPWDIILEYGLNYWDGDIIKRVLRTKEGESRRLDYEKIIHICRERIRQIGMNEPCYEGEQEDRDETTVFCLSEADKPSYFANRYAFDVYSVFESGGQWYAYLGYDNSSDAQMYLGLTSTEFSSINVKYFPVPVIFLSDCLAGVEHSASVKIGALGNDRYEIYDYLINEGRLFRFVGFSEDGKLYRYAKFNGNGNVEFIEYRSRLTNFANQITCEK